MVLFRRGSPLPACELTSARILLHQLISKSAHDSFSVLHGGRCDELLGIQKVFMGATEQQVVVNAAKGVGPGVAPLRFSPLGLHVELDQVFWKGVDPI